MELIKHKLYQYISITRPVNVLIAALTIFIAAIITGGLHPFNNVLLAAISTALITAGANVINDYFDIEVDKINKPDRPLAAEKLSTREGIIFFILLYIIGWICAIYIYRLMFYVAFAVGVLLILYSYKLKRIAFWGNLSVSVASAAVFLYGGLAVDRIHAVWYPAGFALLYHFGREILKDIQDMQGDQKEGLLTLPIKYGIRPSLNITLMTYILLIIFTIIPYIQQVYSINYMLTIIFGVWPVIIFVLYKSMKNPNPENLGNMSNVLKAGMVAGLLAIYLG